jgi:hypothetical protein
MALRAVSGRWAGLARPACGRAVGGMAVESTRGVVARVRSAEQRGGGRRGGSLLGLSHALALIDPDDGG